MTNKLIVLLALTITVPGFGRSKDYPLRDLGRIYVQAPQPGMKRYAEYEILNGCGLISESASGADAVLSFTDMLRARTPQSLGYAKVTAVLSQSNKPIWRDKRDWNLNQYENGAAVMVGLSKGISDDLLNEYPGCSGNAQMAAVLAHVHNVYLDGEDQHTALVKDFQEAGYQVVSDKKKADIWLENIALQKAYDQVTQNPYSIHCTSVGGYGYCSDNLGDVTSFAGGLSNTTITGNTDTGVTVTHHNEIDGWIFVDPATNAQISTWQQHSLIERKLRGLLKQAAKDSQD